MNIHKIINELELLVETEAKFAEHLYSEGDILNAQFRDGMAMGFELAAEKLMKAVKQ